MLIVNRDIFLTLPEGTLYQQVDEYSNPIDSILMKGETIGNDWYEINLSGFEHDDPSEMIEAEEKMKNEISVPLEISACRNGLFEDDNLFLIYESSDKEKLIKFLSDFNGQ